MSSVKKSVNVRIDEDTEKRLDEIAEKENKGISSVIRDIINEYLEPDITNRYRWLDDACPMVRYLEEDEAPKKKGEGFYCLKKAPKEDKLGSGLESAANKYCDVCKFVEGALEDSRILKEQREKGISIEMPRCTKGGYPMDKLENMYCPLIGKKRPVKEKKKKTDYTPCRLGGRNNANCQYLKFDTVVTGLKEKDHR